MVYSMLTHNWRESLCSTSRLNICTCTQTGSIKRSSAFLLMNSPSIGHGQQQRIFVRVQQQQQQQKKKKKKKQQQMKKETKKEENLPPPMAEPDVEPSSAHDFSASLQVEKSLLRFVLGKGGKTKEKIEKDTSTLIHVPLPHEAKHGSCLVVKGSSQEEVDEAVSQIQCVLQEAAESPSLEYSHFISLPLALHPDLVLQVARFHNSVMDLIPTNNTNEAKSSSSLCTGKGVGDDVETTGVILMENEQVVGFGQMDTEMLLDESMEQSKEEYDECDNQETVKETKDNAGLSSGHGIEESILIRPTTLHLTVLMLKLWSKERVATAVEVLQGLKSKLLEALDSRPVAVRLRGLECMKGSPAKAHVLYARVEEANQENRLLQACEIIKEEFIEAGLVSEKDKKQELKLHATLINSSHRKRKRSKRFGKRIPFDARAILSKHGSEEWGEYTITEAHLSERFVFDEDGYYHCCGSLKFPTLS